MSYNKLQHFLIYFPMLQGRSAILWSWLPRPVWGEMWDLQQIHQWTGSGGEISAWADANRDLATQNLNRSSAVPEIIDWEIMVVTECNQHYHKRAAAFHPSLRLSPAVLWGVSDLRLSGDKKKSLLSLIKTKQTQLECENLAYHRSMSTFSVGSRSTFTKTETESLALF